MTGGTGERRAKTNIVRTRTGCQNCRTRRRKCDETRPECLRCVGRGIKCSGYQRTLSFKDVSDVTAKSSQKSEAARWAALRKDGDRHPLNGPRSPLGPRKPPGIVETLSGDDGSDESSSSVIEHSGQSHAGSRPSGTTATPSLTDPLAWADALAGWGAPIGQAGGIRREAESSDDSSSPVNQPFNPSVERSASDPGSGSTQDNNDIILANMEIEPHEGPALDSLARHNRDAGLISHFESNVLSDLPVQLTFGRQYMENSCFRKAVMAISSLHLSYIPNGDGTAGNRRQNGEAVGREYYLAAVRELHKRLDLSDQRSREQHAAAALMLAYYEIETGSPLGSLRHARGVDALLSKMDLTSVSMPDLFRAWRLLHYDVKVIANPYRESTLVVDAHDPYSMLDPQLAIRDIFSQLWHLNGRYSMEAPFSSGGQGSPAQQAAFWTRDALNRVCDKKNCERGDYHKDTLTPDMVIQKCERLTRWMDQWHASSVAEYPAAKLSGAQPFIHGSSFEPFAPLGFSSDRKAHEYLLYVASRLIVSYLMSVVGNSSSASTTEAWARMLLGIVCGLQRQEVIFTYVQTDAFLGLAALLCEGSRTIDAVIEGAIPHILNAGIREADLSEWVYLQKILETARKERMKGKAIRAVCMGLDEDYERRQYQNCCSWAAFGDYNGKGYFREVYTFDN